MQLQCEYMKALDTNDELDVSGVPFASGSMEVSVSLRASITGAS